MEEKVLFLDTNTLLHYPPIQDTDWKKIVGSPTVRLVLCMQVVHELDEKKNDSRLSERASRVIKEIDTILDCDGRVRDGVALEVFAYEVRTADFPDTLSPDSKDDRTVHSVKKYLARHPGANAAVYTEDMGMRLRCQANDVAVEKPDTSKRLPNPASEQDKKHRAALAELDALKTRQPKLGLVVCESGVTLPTTQTPSFRLSAGQHPACIEDELKWYVQRNVLRPMSAPPKPSWATSHCHDFSVSRYNGLLENHLREYREWLERKESLAAIHAHAFEFSLWLTNDGKGPADDLDIQIWFPENLSHLVNSASEDADWLKLPEPPQLPPRNSAVSAAIELYGDLLDNPQLRRIHDLLSAETQISRQGDRAEVSFCITFSSRRVKHHDPVHLGDFIAVFHEDAVASFQADYRITAANLIEPMTGDLSFVVLRANS